MADEIQDQKIGTLPIVSVDADKNNLIDDDISFANELIDPSIQPILKARYTEAKQCINHSPLATIMLCGSLLEGLLLGIAQKHPEEFNKSSSAPKNKDTGTVKPFDEWGLAQFIDAAHELGYIRWDVKKFNHALRNFRNYIHPYQQLKEDFNPDRGTARMSLTAVDVTIAYLREVKKPKDKELDAGFEAQWNRKSG